MSQHISPEVNLIHTTLPGDSLQYNKHWLGNVLTWYNDRENPSMDMSQYNFMQKGMITATITFVLPDTDIGILD